MKTIFSFKISASLRLWVSILLFAFSIFAQTKIPAPKDVLGFTPGDDRKLASWNQVLDYFKKLDAASDRVRFEEIGKTTMGNPFVYATIASPANLKNLEKYKQINQKLADPRLIKSNDRIANSLIKQGKTIVLITCGIHSNEVGSYLSSMLIADKLATATDAETLKILNDTIILLVPSLNPDGVDIIKNWYDKTLGTPFEGTDPPELYNKYVGHDDNRDWYAFTQTETQLTVDKIHNVWHPQIVHDIHQQGAYGSRLFLPPYLPPVEPNVPKEIVEGYTELGNYMANQMREKGFQGITTDSTYDAWTPSRAYSHYHGGVRILSETASCKLATPIKVEFNQLREGLGYNPKVESANFSPVWKGGEWHLRDITNYMTTAAFLLLKHAADNREEWLSRFYAIGKEAVRPRKDGELFAYIIEKGNSLFDESLIRAGVKVEYAGKFTFDGKTYPDFTPVIRLDQPYADFAKAMIEPEIYPDLRDEKGQPIPPYDVTAHNLALLTGAKVVKVFHPFQIPDTPKFGSGIGSGSGCGCGSSSGGDCTIHYATYHSQVPSMDEGWTRWVIDTTPEIHNGCVKYLSIYDKEIRAGSIGRNRTITFPDQSPNQILNGYTKGSMPDEYTGGIGKEGVENLKKFVEAGGTLVFLNRASDFAIEQFDLPVRDVTKDLPRKDFYIPGSILRTELDTTNPIAKDMPKESIAWFENSPAFEITDNANVKVIAKYPADAKNILLSGYALGAEKIAGKAALVQVNYGKGKIILFGFRPQYRGQSLATFPLLFNAIGN
ncbi:MAG: M14 family zinc carboxypeptidase [Pyrinomonadaceae bacterium]